MAWTRQSRRDGREQYHHGNLRQALIDAALTMIAARGLAGFNLAELAREIGVSPAAPYRHFRDRNALLVELARHGFELFEAELSAAWDDGRPDARAAFVRCGRRYLAFARRQPALYATMFESGLPMDADPALHRASERAFAVLVAGAEKVSAGVRGARPPAGMIALHAWSMAHGIAALFVAGQPRALPMPPEDLLEAGMLVYLNGLGGPG